MIANLLRVPKFPRGPTAVAVAVLATVSTAGGFGVGRELRDNGTKTTSAHPARERPNNPKEQRDPILALADKCDVFPSGTVPPNLTPRHIVTSSARDPRTGQTLPVAAVRMDGDMGVSGNVLDSPPFTVTFALLPAVGEPGRGDRLTDRIGAVQLWAFWDGDSLHKAVRTWDGSRWTIVSDGDADDLTTVAGRLGMSFFWAGIADGERYGAFVATPDGCVAEGLVAGLTSALGG